MPITIQQYDKLHRLMHEVKAGKMDYPRWVEWQREWVLVCYECMPGLLVDAVIIGAQKNGIRYPEITVPLVGEDGNVYAIIGRVSRALRRAGVSNDEILAYQAEMKSGDYDHALQTTIRWVKTDRPYEGSNDD